MADVEKQTKNYMLFTVNPLLKKIADEGNVKFFEQNEYLEGKKLKLRPFRIKVFLILQQALISLFLQVHLQEMKSD